MSADDTYIVSRLHNERNKYGIFHHQGDWDSPPSYYNEANAIRVYTHPVAAILAAHRLHRDSPAEYGVYVNSLVLADCRTSYSDTGWRIK